jgi:spore coat polysaccharide biosynthesis protein SpsF (cytidylyltransferase family)
MNIGCIIQARMGSTRLPGKMAMDIGGKPVLWHTVMRAKQIGIPVILAVPDQGSGKLIAIAANCQVDFHLGDPIDVLARYYYAALGRGLDAVMRLCGDQPLIDPAACRRVLEGFKGDWDWCANDYHVTYPVGMGCEIFTFQALEQAHREAKKELDREHVIPWIHRHSQFSHKNFTCPINGISHLRLTVDTQEDLDFIRRIDAAGPKDYSLRSTLEAIDRAQAAYLPAGAAN